MTSRSQERPWEADVRIWITAGHHQGGAIDAIELDGTDVWLYLSERGELIGFVSLGLHCSEAGQPPDAQIVPYLGVSGQFRGQRYGPRIFQWVVDEARRRHRECGASNRLVLYVDPNNTGAHNMYLAFGFNDIGIDNADPRQWIIMEYILN